MTSVTKKGGRGGGRVGWFSGGRGAYRCVIVGQIGLFLALISLGSSLLSQPPWILDLISTDNSVRLVSFFWGVGGGVI